MLQLWDTGNKEPNAQEIKAAVSIVDVVRHYAHVELRGNRADCPFCDGERKGTFAIDSKTGRFKCHRCGRQGDIFAFVQALYGVGFHDAVMMIAKDYGLERCSQGTHAALQAAAALSREGERQRREATEDANRWGDLWVLYDSWRRTYPPEDPRYIEAVTSIDWVSDNWDSALMRLKNFEQ